MSRLLGLAHRRSRKGGERRDWKGIEECYNQEHSILNSQVFIIKDMDLCWFVTTTNTLKNPVKWARGGFCTGTNGVKLLLMGDDIGLCKKIYTFNRTQENIDKEFTHDSTNFLNKKNENSKVFVSVKYHFARGSTFY